MISPNPAICQHSASLRKACLLVALLAPATARASCTAAQQFNFSFATATAATLSYAGNSTYTATNTAGATLKFTVSFAANNMTGTTLNTGTTNVQMPAIDNLIDSTTGNNLVIGGTFAGRTTALPGSTNSVDTILTFASPVRDLKVMINDVDYTSNQFRDWIYVSGVYGANAYVPAITTPYTNNNSTSPGTATNSTIEVGVFTSPVTVTSSQAAGTANSPNTGSLTGTMYASWLQPVTVANIYYGNYPYQTGENTTGQQAIGIETVSFCPMPVVSVAKTSSVISDPVNGTTNPKAIPGAVLAYTLTVTNTGGSPVDASSTALTDVLPATTTFSNSAISPGTTNFVFTPNSSGVTLAPANVSYSNNAGSTYAYTPAAGYDTNVQAVKYVPQGSMAASSSFSIQYYALIR